MTTPHTSPAAAAPRTPLDHTHPCARCGAPVALNIGLCERCNPLGLRDAASSQVHGTVVFALVLAFVGLAVAAQLAVSGIGPFAAEITGVRVEAGVLIASLRITNEGTSAGTSTCRVSDPVLRGSGKPAFITTPRIGPTETVTFDTRLVDFGGEPRPLEIVCSAP